MNIDALTVDQWIARLGFTSDYALAKHFRIAAKTVSYYRENNVRIAQTGDGLKRISDVKIRQ